MRPADKTNPSLPASSTFRSFLREVRFTTIAGLSVLLFIMVFGMFEILAVVLGGSLSDGQMRLMHLSRGVITVGVLLLWIAWALYETRDRFLQVVHQHDGLHRRILEASGDAVFMASQDDRLVFLNPAAGRLLGDGEDQIRSGLRVGGPVPDLPARFLDGGYEDGRTLEWVDSAGRHRFLSGTRAVLHDSGGQVESRLLIVRDLTEGSIRLAQMERSERLASIGHMAAGVAHEIGNPLTAISSMVQLLQRQIREESQSRKLTQIRGHIARITKIVRDLADISRPRPEQVIDIRMAELVENVFGLLRHDARCRGVRFTLHADGGEDALTEDALTVSAVYDRLYQVLLNLLLNSVDAMALGADAGEADAGEVQTPAEGPEVTVALKPVGERLQVRVTDNGKGIPPEIRRRIFEPFFSTKQVGKGTGLGLYVSHQLVEKCGGTIILEASEPGRTTFLIEFPRRAEPRETPAPAQGSGAAGRIRSKVRP